MMSQEGLLRDRTSADQVTRAAANELATAIESVPDGDMSGAIETPWGPYPLPQCCLHAYWNMVYHEGQINYVQTLYGDFEEHEPA